MPQIKDSEKHQRALKQDIGYLQGEKEELIDEREDMSRTAMFLQRATVGMIAVFITAALMLVMMHFTAGWDIIASTAILILLVFAIESLLYYFKRRIRMEMKLNIKKQHRAIEQLNKKSVVYAYYTNYLRFSYNKYKVKNSRMLENNLKDFGNYKFLANRIDTCRRLMYETEDMIDTFMKEKKLTGIKATIESFARTVNLEDKKRYYNTLLSEKKVSEQELTEMEERHEEIWDTLIKINEADKSHNHVIEKIITTYLDEAGKLFEQVDSKANNDSIAKSVTEKKIKIDEKDIEKDAEAAS
jgi:hypothetical protein